MATTSALVSTAAPASTDVTAVPVITEDIDTLSEEEIEYYCSFTGRSSITLKGRKIVVSSLLTTLWEIIEKVMNKTATEAQQEGLWIHGPMGTGKTTSLLYLAKKLKIEDCVVLMSSISPTEEYLKWFCEKNLINLTDVPATTSGILHHIFYSYHPPKRFLLAEMGNIRYHPIEYVRDFCVSVQCAVKKGWYVVIASSSGLGWQLTGFDLGNHPNFDSQKVKEYVRSFSIQFENVASKNFTREEAIEYIRIIKAAEPGHEEKEWDEYFSKATNGNPLLLGGYFNASNSVDQKVKGDQFVSAVLRDIAINLVRSRNDQVEVFMDTIEQCHVWLGFAIQEYPIPIRCISQYYNSYCAYEHLTYVRDKNDTHFVLQIAFPNLYKIFVEKCMSNAVPDCIYKSPAVQGLIFEEQFLHHYMLHDLNVTAIARDNSSKAFAFTIASSAPQLDGALSKISLFCMHHLRPGHRAIDAVCLSRDQNSHDMYLLLLQVSLSSYSDHRSKSLSIREAIISPEKGDASNTTVSIAEFYRKMVNNNDGVNISEDHVMFIYASPKALRQPRVSDFHLELNQVETRSGATSQSYLYGFIDQNSSAASILQELQLRIQRTENY